MNSKLEAVLNYYKEGIENGNIESAMDNHLADTFTHHSTYGKEDKAGALQRFTKFFEEYTNREFEIVRTITDGDEVFLHIKASLNGEAFIYTDFFRLNDGNKIEEQWTISSAFAKTTPSGHTSTDGPREHQDLDKTEGNKEIARNIIHNGLMTGDPSLLSNFISSEQYIQHNKDVADGSDHFMKLAIAPGRNLNYSEIETLLGEGNFVVVRCKATWTEGEEVTGFTQVDLFRFEDGMAVEHWDNVEPYNE